MYSERPPAAKGTLLAILKMSRPALNEDPVAGSISVPAKSIPGVAEFGTRTHFSWLMIDWI